MLLRNLISGSRILRAPEDDQGFEPENHDGQGQEEGFEEDGDAGGDQDFVEDEESGADREEDDAAGDAREASRRSDDVGQRRPSRGENRVQRALNEAKAAREEAAALREEIRQQGLRAQEQQRETPAQRAARLASLSSDEYAAELVREQREETNRALGSIQLQLADTADRGTFAALCARNPVVAGLADEVERKLAEARRNGANTSREAIATFLIGQRTLAKASKVAPKQREAAARSRDDQRGRPSGGRSDARPAARGGDDRAARKARLENLEI